MTKLLDPEDMTDFRVVARRVVHDKQSWDVPVLSASTVTGADRDVLDGREPEEFGDFDVLQRLVSKALGRS